MPKIEWEIPLRTVSEMNCSEHWTVRSKRHKKQKLIVKTILKKDMQFIKPPCHIKITRNSPKIMDFDNLCASQKYVLDAICELITPGLACGRADGVLGIKASYYQEKARKHFIKVEIEY